MAYYNGILETNLSHAENRIKNCLSNYLVFCAQEDEELAASARAAFLTWTGKAQDLHQEDHF